MRRARSGDIPELVNLMSEFYAESGYNLNGGRAETAFAAILADDRLGYVWFIEEAGKHVGYVVLTLKFGMEYGGLIACIDDFFVAPSSRNKGLSTAALREVRDFCGRLGICAIMVEVSFSSGPAQAVYRRIGLVEVPDRQLLVLPLAPPTHVDTDTGIGAR